MRLFWYFYCRPLTTIYPSKFITMMLKIALSKKNLQHLDICNLKIICNIKRDPIQSLLVRALELSNNILKQGMCVMLDLFSSECWIDKIQKQPFIGVFWNNNSENFCIIYRETVGIKLVFASLAYRTGSLSNTSGQPLL